MRPAVERERCPVWFIDFYLKLCVMKAISTALITDNEKQIFTVFFGN